MFVFGGGKCPNLGVVNFRILGVVNVLLANDSQSKCDVHEQDYDLNESDFDCKDFDYWQWKLYIFKCGMCCS